MDEIKINTSIQHVTVEGNTLADRAHEIWNTRTPSERGEILATLGMSAKYCDLHISLRHRAAINYIIDNIDKY